MPTKKLDVENDTAVLLATNCNPVRRQGSNRSTSRSQNSFVMVDKQSHQSVESCVPSEVESQEGEDHPT